MLSVHSSKLNPPADYPFFITWIPQSWNIIEIHSKNVIEKTHCHLHSRSQFLLQKSLPQLIQKCREQTDKEANYSHKVSPEKNNSLESLFKLAPNLHQYTPKQSAERSSRESRQMLCLGSKSEKSPGPKETFPHLLMCTLKKKAKAGHRLSSFLLLLS